MASGFLDHGPAKPSTPASLTLEAWSQGMMVGGLVFMIMLTVANMRRGSLLHKLILIELVIALPNGFFIFFDAPVYGWYLSSTAMFIIMSWTLHNIVAWMKSKPFLTARLSYIYIGTVALAQAYWILEIFANFEYYNEINTSLFPKTRPFEALCRDPWWLFTTCNLVWNIKHHYSFSVLELIKASPRFGILLLSMCMSIGFIVVDVLAVTSVLDIGGINPFWKFAFVFKCFTDTIFLDDFKTVLDRLWEHKMRANNMRHDGKLQHTDIHIEELSSA